MAGTRRARSEAAKEARRASICAAALALFQERGYAEVTMARVARHAGLAKGTLYLYFPTKEALFLALLVERVEDLFGCIQRDLSALPPGSSPEHVAALLSRSLLDRPVVVDLLTLLHLVLEQNLDVDTARAFKLTLYGLVAVAGAALERALPGLAAGEGALAFLRVHALVVGLGQMSRITPVLEEVMSTPPLSDVRFNLELELEPTLAALLRGMLRNEAGRR
ncbi:MAG: TetR family transcriptional regulator [Alphaproteobacteria bacterium]|nr:TetR family transcriptional regulator [Alphaproteobacteria bacterium]